MSLDNVNNTNTNKETLSTIDIASDGSAGAPSESTLPPLQPAFEGASKSDNECDQCDFQMGDHVYQWCSLVGIPAVYQHHGIVMDVYRNNNGEWMLQIADFSNNDNSSSSSDQKNRKKSLIAIRAGSSSGRIRTYECPVFNMEEGNNNNNKKQKYNWYKVSYQAGWWQRHWNRSGTCTAVESDAPALVRARVQFLLENPDVLPEYGPVKSNCECVAVWCKTGTWATLQASSWLAMTAAGQAKSAVTVAGAVAGTQVTVPAAGAWGWLGFTTQASLVSMHPFLLPAIAAYGVVTAGAPAVWLALAKQHWKELTITLNEQFWENAVSNPEIFVQCITEFADSSSAALMRDYSEKEPPTLEFVVKEEEEVPVVKTATDQPPLLVKVDEEDMNANGTKKTESERGGGAIEQSTGQASNEGRTVTETKIKTVVLV